MAATLGLAFWLMARHPGFRTGVTGVVTTSIAWLRTAGPGVFFAGMAILPAFGFPLLPFTLAAGPAFADRMGVAAVALCAVGAIAVNVTLSYALAARAFGPLVRRIIARLGYTLPALPPGTAWQAVLIVRLTPGPPFWVQSYVLGLMRTAWVPYIIGSTLVPSIYIVGVIVAGDALWSGRMKPALVAAAALGIVGCGVRLWRSRRARASTPDPATQTVAVR